MSPNAIDKGVKPIRVLDCTLRDGGYCNQWKFGEKNIKRIIKDLETSNIDIIECGFVTDKVQRDVDSTKYTSIEAASSVLPHNGADSISVVMVNYGEYGIDRIPIHSQDLVDGIRVAFHKKNVIGALAYCKEVKNKGYKVFVQAMVTMSYTDVEFLELITKVNELSPYAFYIVDSFGMMRKHDLIRYYSLAEKNLNNCIEIGFHSHNNLQLAYSNTIALLELRSGRRMIIDSTIYGMGRGAGNLNTELFIEYLNREFDEHYDLKIILKLMDEIINNFYKLKPWGYSLPNYLSAIHGVHPNYASYLSDKNTMTIDMMDDVFASMDVVKKNEFDKEYIEDLYLKIMGARIIHYSSLDTLKAIFGGKTVLLIAPGRNSYVEHELIADYVSKEELISISINFLYPFVPIDYCFVSNNIRYKDLSDLSNKCIITSNIVDQNDNIKNQLIVSYTELLNDNEYVKDNSGLMAIKLMTHLGVDKIILAGFDGYSYNIANNYVEGQRIFHTNKDTIDATNQGLAHILNEMSHEISVRYLTKPTHILDWGLEFDSQSSVIN